MSGFCNQSNPPDSHERCAGCGCGCHVTTAPQADVLTALDVEVTRLEDQHDALLEACTDPQATDMAELFDTLARLRKRLQAVERDTELALAQAMVDDYAETATLRVERSRGADRKAWQHDEWQRDVRAKTLRKLGLAGAQGVLSADGEVLPASVLYDALAAVQAVHGAAGPKSTALRALGMDVRDYCESSPGAWHVRVTRMADENREDKVA